MASPPALPAVDNTQGALFVGVVLSTGLWGASCIQLYYYTERFPNDALHLKALVLLTWALDTAHQALITHTSYTYLVSHYAQPAYLDHVVKSLWAMVLLSGLTCVVVQLFLVWRIWRCECLSASLSLLPLCCLSSRKRLHLLAQRAVLWLRYNVKTSGYFFVAVHLSLITFHLERFCLSSFPSFLFLIVEDQPLPCLPSCDKLLCIHYFLPLSSTLVFDNSISGPPLFIPFNPFSLCIWFPRQSEPVNQNCNVSVWRLRLPFPFLFSFLLVCETLQYTPLSSVLHTSICTRRSYLLLLIPTSFVSLSDSSHAELPTHIVSYVLPFFSLRDVIFALSFSTARNNLNADASSALQPVPHRRSEPAQHLHRRSPPLARLWRVRHRPRSVPLFSYLERPLTLRTAYFIKSASITSLTVLPALDNLSRAVNAMGAASDLAIALTLVALLHRARTGFRRSETIINRLILFSINTGLLTSMCAVLSLVTITVFPSTFIYMTFFVCVSRLYTNTLYATLNARRSNARGEAEDSDADAEEEEAAGGWGNYEAEGAGGKTTGRGKRQRPTPSTISMCRFDTSRAGEVTTLDMELGLGGRRGLKIMVDTETMRVDDADLEYDCHHGHQEKETETEKAPQSSISESASTLDEGERALDGVPRIGKAFDA